MKNETVTGSRAARLKASRRYWREAHTVSRRLANDVRRPLLEEREALLARLLGARMAPAEEAPRPRFHVVMGDLTAIHEPTRLSDFACHALERAVFHVSAHFEPDENGWPVWRMSATDPKDEGERRP